MTAAEYLDPNRFPLTTQKGLTISQQMMIDAMNYDDVMRMEEEGREMDEEQKGRAVELREKHPHRAEVAAEARRQEIAAKSVAR